PPMSWTRFARGTPYSFAKMIRFSSTLSSRSLVRACGMTPIVRRTSSAWVTMSYPLTRAVPAVGGRSVTSMRMSVDLPAPFGPSRPKISPSSTAKLTPFTAVKSPNFLTIPRTSIAGMAASAHGQGHVGRHAEGQAAVGVVHPQPDLEGLDVALRPAHVALGRVGRVHPAEEDEAGLLDAGGETHGEPVADPHAVDVGLL